MLHWKLNLSYSIFQHFHIYAYLQFLFFQKTSKIVFFFNLKANFCHMIANFWSIYYGYWCYVHILNMKLVNNLIYIFCQNELSKKNQTISELNFGAKCKTKMIKIMIRINFLSPLIETCFDNSLFLVWKVLICEICRVSIVMFLKIFTPLFKKYVRRGSRIIMCIEVIEVVIEQGFTEGNCMEQGFDVKIIKNNFPELEAKCLDAENADDILVDIYQRPETSNRCFMTLPWSCI